MLNKGLATGAIVEEFFSVTEEETGATSSTAAVAVPSQPSLAERLDAQMQHQAPSAVAHGQPAESTQGASR